MALAESQLRMDTACQVRNAQSLGSNTAAEVARQSITQSAAHGVHTVELPFHVSHVEAVEDREVSSVQPSVAVRVEQIEQHACQLVVAV